MRNEYSKVLRTHFAKLVKSRLPEFSTLKTKSPYLFPGERAYYAERGDVWLVVILSPNPKGREAFNIEVGWSVHKRFPELPIRPSIMEPPTGEGLCFEEPEAVVTLQTLSGDGANADNAWLIEQTVDPFDVSGANMDKVLAEVSVQQARARVMPVVEAAFEELMSIGIPFLEGCARHRDADGAPPAPA